MASRGQELSVTLPAKFEPITIRMAKEQNLLSTTKISGLCGRLMCCLSYEWTITSSPAQRA